MFAYRSIFHEQARPAAIRESRRAPWLAVGVVCLGAFMGQLDASIVTITFPSMEHAFRVPAAAVQWVSLVYLLGLIAMLAPAGRLGDGAGRKLIYTWGFAVFTVASLACGLAPSLAALVVLRLLQAAGAAMLQSNSVALVATSAPGGKMRFALGVQAGAQSVGLALGPTLGGLLTSTLGWRAVYWVNVPVGVAAIAAGRYLLPRTRRLSPRERFDWPGTLLLVAWTSALLLVLSAASGLSLPGWLVGAFAVLTLAGGIAFFRRETSTRYPLIPGWLLRSVPVTLALAGATCGYLVLFGPLMLIPQVLAGNGGAARTGLLLSALPLGFGVAALFGDAVLPKSWPNRPRGVAGATLACVVMGAAAVGPVTEATAVPQLALAGLGLGLFVPANNATVMRAAADSTASLVGGLVNMARGIGTAFGISLMALALHLGNPDGSGHGYAGATQARPAFIVLAVVAGAAAVIALASRAGADPGVPGRRTRQVQIAEENLAHDGAAPEGTTPEGTTPEGTTPEGTTPEGTTPGNTAPGNTALKNTGPQHVSQEQVGPEMADIVSRLRRAMRRAARAADPALGLSVAQLELLSCIAEHPGVRPSQLARMLRLAPSSVATLLNGLQSAGYVVRTPGGEHGSAGDRRTVSLHLSDDGAAAVTRWHRVNEEIVQAALASLPPHDRATLRHAAPALRDLTLSIDALAD